MERDSTPRTEEDNNSGGLNRAQRWATGSLLVVLALTRVFAASPDMSTEPLPVPTEWRTLRGDSITYDMPAYNLLAGNGYSSALAAPYAPSVLRTPTYPLVLAGIYAALGRTEVAVVGVNLLFDLAAAVLLFFLSRRLLPSWWAIGFLGAVVLFAPWSAFLGDRLSEPLTTLLLVSSLWLCVRGPTPMRWLLLGLCLGALLLCRPAFALLPAAIALWTALLDGPRPRGRTGALVTALFVGLVAVWGPWVTRNALVFDRFVPLAAGGSGLSLWLGTWHSRGKFWKVHQAPDGTYQRSLHAHAFASEAERERVVPQFDRYIELYFTNGGITMSEPDGIFRDVAMERILAHPERWLALRAAGTVELLQQRYFFVDLIRGEPSPSELRMERLRRGSLTRSETGWEALFEKAEVGIGWVIGVLAVLGAILSLRRRQWQPIALFFLYTWWIHFPTHAEPRYLAPAYGAAMLLATLALHEGATKIRTTKLASAQKREHDHR